MRLLVSVRSVEEVSEALVGGAHIIDIKEPSRGALGAADPDVIRAVAAEVPPSIPVSVALGDPDTAGVPVSVSRRAPYREAGETILKLGFAGAMGEIEAEQRLIAAMKTASADPRPTVVAVAYADYERARAPSPSAVVRAAARAGADGVLLDTFTKDRGDLFAFFSPEALQRWVEEARSLRLMVALAGSLDSRRHPPRSLDAPRRRGGSRSRMQWRTSRPSERRSGEGPAARARRTRWAQWPYRESP